MTPPAQATYDNQKIFLEGKDGSDGSGHNTSTFSVLMDEEDGSFDCEGMTVDANKADHTQTIRVTAKVGMQGPVPLSWSRSWKAMPDVKLTLEVRMLKLVCDIHVRLSAPSVPQTRMKRN